MILRLSFVIDFTYIVNGFRVRKEVDSLGEVLV